MGPRDDVGAAPRTLARRPAGPGAAVPLLVGSLLLLGLPALPQVGLSAGSGPAGALPASEGPVPVPTFPQECPEPVAVEAPGSPLEWRAAPGLEGSARALAGRRGLAAPLPAIGPPEAFLAGSRPTVYLLRDLACLGAHGLARPQPDWVAGVASAEGGFVALRADPARGDLRELGTVFRHELAHLALSAATGDRAPRWLQEGYAQYASGSWNWREAWRIRLALLFRGEDPLRELRLGFPGNAEGARLAYLLSYTAVSELVRMAGEPGLAAFFAELREGATLDGALRRVYGLSLHRFEERWRERTEARYGWLYLLSRASVFWVAVTLLLLWMGWRRRRRDRRRMEALREAERREAARGEERKPWADGGWTPGRPPRGMP